MTAWAAPAQQPDPELLTRVESRRVRCPRCAAEPDTQCAMTRYPPPTKKAPQTYHGVRLTRAREGW